MFEYVLYCFLYLFIGWVTSVVAIVFEKEDLGNDPYLITVVILLWPLILFLVGMIQSKKLLTKSAIQCGKSLREIYNNYKP